MCPVNGCLIKFVKYKYVNIMKYEIVPAMLKAIFSKTACYLIPQDIAKEMRVEEFTGKSEEAVGTSNEDDRVTAAENLAKK